MGESEPGAGAAAAAGAAAGAAAAPVRAVAAGAAAGAVSKDHTRAVSRAGHRQSTGCRGRLLRAQSAGRRENTRERARGCDQGAVLLNPDPTPDPTPKSRRSTGSGRLSSDRCCGNRGGSSAGGGSWRRRGGSRCSSRRRGGGSWVRLPGVRLVGLRVEGFHASRK